MPGQSLSSILIQDSRYQLHFRSSGSNGSHRKLAVTSQVTKPAASLCSREIMVLLWNSECYQVSCSTFHFHGNLCLAYSQDGFRVYAKYNKILGHLSKNKKLKQIFKAFRCSLEKLLSMVSVICGNNPKVSNAEVFHNLTICMF